VDYLLDTNACIATINGKPPKVRARLQKEIAAGARILVSSITLFELWYGVGKSAKQDFNRNRLEIFLSGPVAVISFEEPDSRVAGSVRATLEAAGKPIGAYDLLIAGQALCHQVTLVTSNISEFSRIKNLDWEDWAKS
jgi:tRNA(fMet)-specific endonuclease VapC